MFELFRSNYPMMDLQVPNDEQISELFYTAVELADEIEGSPILYEKVVRVNTSSPKEWVSNRVNELRRFAEQRLRKA